MRGLVLCGTVVLATATMLATAALAQSASKDDCATRQTKNCKLSATKDSSQSSSPNGSQGSHGFPGADADVPSDSPSDDTPTPASKEPDTPKDNKEPAPPPSSFKLPTDNNEPAPPPESMHSGGDSHTPKPSDGYSTSQQQQEYPNSSDPHAKDAPAPTTQDDDTPVKSAPLQDLGARRDFTRIHEKLDETRVADDLKVAKFYASDGNLQGAYLRYKDAIEHDETEEDAYWGLANLAERMKKPDEARQNYETYLTLAPDGDHAEEAKASIKRLGKSGSSAARK